MTARQVDADSEGKTTGVEGKTIPVEGKTIPVVVEPDAPLPPRVQRVIDLIATVAIRSMTIEIVDEPESRTP